MFIHYIYSIHELAIKLKLMCSSRKNVPRISSCKQPFRTSFRTIQQCIFCSSFPHTLLRSTSLSSLTVVPILAAPCRTSTFGDFTEFFQTIASFDRFPFMHVHDIKPELSEIFHFMNILRSFFLKIRCAGNIFCVVIAAIA